MLGMRLLALLGGLCMAGPVQAFAPRGVPASGSLQPALFRGVLRPRAGVRGLRLANDDYFDVANRRVLVQAAGVAVLSGLARSDRRCVCARARVSLTVAPVASKHTHKGGLARTHARTHALSPLSACQGCKCGTVWVWRGPGRCRLGRGSKGRGASCACTSASFPRPSPDFAHVLVERGP